MKYGEGALRAEPTHFARYERPATVIRESPDHETDHESHQAVRAILGETAVG